MHAIGLDIGTTSVSAVRIDLSSGKVVHSETREHRAGLPAVHPWERRQDPARILDVVRDMLSAFLYSGGKVSGMGVTGQMHGILYVDERGQALSPSYTWQDGRGTLPHPEGGTWATTLSRLTGYPLASGFGVVTHAVNRNRNLVPEQAAGMCGIVDYIALQLAGARQAVTDSSQAAAMGCFDLSRNSFDEKALALAGSSPDLLPRVAQQPFELGRYLDQYPVFAGMGDNQASFLGAVGNHAQSILVNIGTGSQISVFSREPLKHAGLEPRPFPGGGFLLVGAPLCGGKAYALLMDFYARVLDSFGCRPGEDLYEVMNRWAASALESGEDLPEVDPRFLGSRSDPNVLGAIRRITMENFSPPLLTAAFLKGMAGELHACLDGLPKLLGSSLHTLVGSGNAVRRNPALQGLLADTFGLPLQIPVLPEEAATGAALWAGLGTGVLKDRAAMEEWVDQSTAFPGT